MYSELFSELDPEGNQQCDVEDYLAAALFYDFQNFYSSLHFSKAALEKIQATFGDVEQEVYKEALFLINERVCAFVHGFPGGDFDAEDCNEFGRKTLHEAIGILYPKYVKKEEV